MHVIVTYDVVFADPVVRIMLMFFFFKQKTAYEMRISDWSSDVCSSDLAVDMASPGLEFLDGTYFWEANPRYAQADQTTFDKFYREAVGVDATGAAEIGRASCRERVCQYV